MRCVLRGRGGGLKESQNYVDIIEVWPHRTCGKCPAGSGGGVRKPDASCVDDPNANCSYFYSVGACYWGNGVKEQCKWD